MRKHSGFTLIEIAIVLVIIGLLLGGVLKGQSMIDSAVSGRQRTTKSASTTSMAPPVPTVRRTVPSSIGWTE